MKKPRPTISYLREIFSYDPDSGVLFWKKPTGRRAKVGGRAGCYDKRGYGTIQINLIQYQLHHVIFAFVTGAWPIEIVDHIDGNPGNNRLSNLRAATQSENLMNAKIRKNNHSGVKGVSWSVKEQRWCCHMVFNGKCRYLGSFILKEDAIATIREARNKHHGQFARH